MSKSCNVLKDEDIEHYLDIDSDEEEIFEDEKDYDPSDSLVEESDEFDSDYECIGNHFSINVTQNELVSDNGIFDLDLPGPSRPNDVSNVSVIDLDCPGPSSDVGLVRPNQVGSKATSRPTIASKDRFVGNGNKRKNISVPNKPRPSKKTKNDRPSWKFIDKTEKLLDFPPVFFTKVSGYVPPAGHRPSTELEFFQLFMTDELLTEITNETNRYTAEKIQKITPLRKRSIWHNWTPVTIGEIKAFLGVVINMGLHEKSSLQEYFSEEWTEKQSFFKDIFSRNRFYQIFWGFHLCPPNHDIRNRSRGDKLKNVVAYLDNKCMQYFVPSYHVSLDESTVGFKGRIKFKCYNKDKPTKWGLKIFVLADSKNGYIWSFLPYYGQATTDMLLRPELLVTSRTVLHFADKLLEKFPDCGFILYVDRYYNSLELALELKKLNIHITGTVQGNRAGLPLQVSKKTHLKNLNLQQQEYASFTLNDSIHCLVWRDKRYVTMLSTSTGNSTEVVERRVKGKVLERVCKPSVICEYNRYMGGVDLADHYISSYNFGRKSIKWWRKLFFWMLEVSIVNSYLLYCCEFGHLEQKKYRKNLIHQLVGATRNADRNKKPGRPSTSDSEERLNKLPHFIYLQEKNTSKDCAVCSNRKVPGGRKETKFYCKTCTRKPGLHPGNCFERYHTLRDYKLF